MHMAAEYVVFVYEFIVLIFKQSGELLQKIEQNRLNPHTSSSRFKYVKASMNPVGESELVLLA